MAFTTEFVLGAGGGVEEIPVSMSGSSGNGGTTYPLATVDAGGGALIAVTGTVTASGGAGSPHLKIGSATSENFADALKVQPWGVAGTFTGIVNIAILARGFNLTTTFTGTVYVARL